VPAQNVLIKSDEPALLPYARRTRSRSKSVNLSLEKGSDVTISPTGSTGGTGSDQGEGLRSMGRRSSVAIMHSHTMKLSEGGSGTPARPAAKHWLHRNSQIGFYDKMQTVIIFDWDDTLFPTTYIQDDLGLKWQEPLHRQPHLHPSVVAQVKHKLEVCEQRAADVLQRAQALAHVVVVTLASSGWVDLACEHFFPTVGDLLKKMNIPIVYAQDLAGDAEVDYDKQQFQSNEEIERFWGLVKGRAINQEVRRFYSQYEGQSWKNVLSIGDSSFERYGLLAATSAYMQGRNLGASEGSDAAVWNPTQEGCWQKVEEGHIKKLRAKCCKLVDQPDADELTVELEMVAKWLLDMVRLDDGFDLDLEILEDESQIDLIEAVLSGSLPVTDLPAPPKIK